MTTHKNFEYRFDPKVPFAATLAFSTRRPTPKTPRRALFAPLGGWSPKRLQDGRQRRQPTSPWFRSA